MSEAGTSGGVSELKLNLIPCGNCGKESSLCCGNCRKESFCSSICQKARRKKHKLICFPAKEEIGEGFRYGDSTEDRTGRFWVATRDIEEGERIFTDYPLMAGPGIGGTDAVHHICLGCHEILKDFVLETDKRKCGDCGWPLCGDGCPGIERHHKECKPLRSMRGYKSEFDDLGNTAGTTHGVYGAIRYIRLLALMRDDPIKWESFLNLYTPDMMESRMIRLCALDANEIENSFRILNRAYQLELTQELFLRLSAAEAFHHRPPYFPRKNIDELVIYDKETRMDWSCMENCYLTQIPVSEKMKDPNGIAFVAVKRIQKGERLSRSFGPNPKWDGTKRRRDTLRTIGEIGFMCKCARCCDPTELGTNVSAIKCTKCKFGLILPLNPFNNKSKWKCNTEECSRLLPASDVDKVVNQIQKEADALSRHPLPVLSQNNLFQNLVLIDRVSKFVEKFEKILNPNHYILLKAQGLTIRVSTILYHQAIRPDKPLSPGLSQIIDEHRRIAGIFLHVGSKIFPPLSHTLLAAHFYVGMSNFFSAQQAVRNEETCDVVQDWLKQGISHRRYVSEFKIKMSFTFSSENNAEYQALMTSLGEAYENALELCRLTPKYNVIPENTSEFDQNICTAGVPT